MSTLTRIKQALLVVGLLTVLGVLALAGVVVYLWWDARRDDEAFETGTEFDPETDVDGEVGDAGVDTIDDGTDVDGAEADDEGGSEAEGDTDAETDATAG